jgi:hypothetical protein
MATRNHALSAMLSALVVLFLIGLGQVFKTYMSATRPGNLVAGCELIF